jgi:hypothetical protein
MESHIPDPPQPPPVTDTERMTVFDEPELLYQEVVGNLIFSSVVDPPLGRDLREMNHRPSIPPVTMNSNRSQMRPFQLLGRGTRGYEWMMVSARLSQKYEFHGILRMSLTVDCITACSLQPVGWGSTELKSHLV